MAGSGAARREDRGAGAFAAEESARAFRARARGRRARAAAAGARNRLAICAARRCAAAHRWCARAARLVPRGPAAAAPAHELRAARRRGQGHRSFTQPREPARQARRRVAAALCEAVALTTGAKTWVFGDLPEKQDVQAARVQVGYPALVDEGETVGLRVSRHRPKRDQPRPRLRAAHPPGDGARLKSYRRDLAVNVQGETLPRAAGIRC